MASRALASLGRRGQSLLLALLGFALSGQAPVLAAQPESFTFDLMTSAGAAACLPDARGEVKLTSHLRGDLMDVKVSGLPANTTSTVFVLKIPHAPFGLSWYQGDIGTDEYGSGRARFLGIFSDETFVVAPNIADAPIVHPADADANPPTAPVHMFHVGTWTADALAAGCSGNQTPFNGDHTAGIQVLNTTDNDGPIGQSTP